MPINFEPMADISGAQAYGQSLARREDRDFAQRSSQAAAEIGLRSSALAQADEHFQAQLADHRGQSIMHEQGQMARQESGQNHQEYMAKLSADLDANKLNQVEDIRRQRLERQVDYVRANSGDGRKYTAEVGGDMITQLMTDLNPMQMRLQRAQATEHELNRQQVLDFNAQQTTLQNMGQSAAAGNAQQDPRFTIRGANGEITHRLVPDGRGGLHLADVRSPHRAAPHPEISSADILRDLRPHGGSSSGEGTGAGGTGGLAPVPTQSQMEASATAHGQAADIARRAQDELQRRTPGGPLPFARMSPDRDVTRQPLTGTERGQQLINAAAARADENHDRDRSELVRSIAGEIRSGKTTGQLTPEQQGTLREIGYYRGEFTPALDRELGRIESPPSEDVGRLESGSRVTVSAVAPQPVKDAARGIRDLLGQYGSMGSMPVNARTQFAGHLAAIRVFRWGQDAAQQEESHYSANDPPARRAAAQAEARRQQAEQERRRQQATVQAFTSGV